MAIGAVVVLMIILAAILIGGLIYFKPYDVDVIKVVPALLDQDTPKTSTYDHPLLSTDQEGLLESAGINTAELPTEITAEQQKCAIDLFGTERLAEILSGDTPTISEIIKGKQCLD